MFSQVSVSHSVHGGGVIPGPGRGCQVYQRGVAIPEGEQVYQRAGMDIPGVWLYQRVGRVCQRAVVPVGDGVGIAEGRGGVCVPTPLDLGYQPGTDN